jgi:hypothetical protein
MFAHHHRHKKVFRCDPPPGLAHQLLKKETTCAERVTKMFCGASPLMADKKNSGSSKMVAFVFRIVKRLHYNLIVWII